MIVEFTVENFLSYKEKHTFSLVATKDKELSESNTFVSDKNLGLLKTAVIYGANASGKSSFFNALSFFLWFSVYSGPRKQAEDPIEAEPFVLSKQTEAAPSSFEIIFIVKNDNEETKYRYGFSVTKKEVIKEYLYAIYNVREVNLFTRENQEISTTSYFREGIRSKQSVRNNCTFLSVCAQNNGDVSKVIIKYFTNITIDSGFEGCPIFTKKNLKESATRRKVVKFLKNADMQIVDIKTEVMPLDSKDDVEPEVKAFVAYLQKKNPDFSKYEKLYFGHTMYDGKKSAGIKFLSENSESAGTKKLLEYSLPVLDALKNGTPLFIDEFDNSLHPLLIETIINLFNSPKTNPNNAQLVISCHAVNIMTNKLFRRDQIWFCEKDKYGVSRLYSLIKFKEPVSVRKDATFNKSYLQGTYGAIPYIENILDQIEAL